MSKISLEQLHQRLGSLGITLTHDDEQDVLGFTNRLLAEGAAVSKAVAPGHSVHPLFSIADPDLFDSDTEPTRNPITASNLSEGL